MATRVLIVDDSILFRTKLQLTLNADPDIKVIGCAVDAEDAFKQIELLHPDVITLDIEMPKTNGIEFLKQLLPIHAIPAVVVTSLPMHALDALQAGAVEFVKKPSAGSRDALYLFLEELKSKIKIASHAKVHPGMKHSSSSFISRLSKTSVNMQQDIVIAIGASTGGTEAILQVVKNLPETTPGIVIVQHMPANFTTLYAQRLNKLCKMQVKEASDFDRVQQGQILLAAGDYHLQIRKDAKGFYVRSRQGAKVSGHCPSVDVLFNSVAETVSSRAIGVILTGMGSDGAKGLLHMHQSGAYTIGQDKESCVVYGMPMAAYQLGGVSRQLGLDQISDEILYRVNRMSAHQS